MAKYLSGLCRGMWAFRWPTSLAAASLIGWGIAGSYFSPEAQLRRLVEGVPHHAGDETMIAVSNAELSIQSRLNALSPGWHVGDRSTYVHCAVTCGIDWEFRIHNRTAEKPFDVRNTLKATVSVQIAPRPADSRPHLFAPQRYVWESSDWKWDVAYGLPSLERPPQYWSGDFPIKAPAPAIEGEEAIGGLLRLIGSVLQDAIAKENASNTLPVGAQLQRGARLLVALDKF